MASQNGVTLTISSDVWEPVGDCMSESDAQSRLLCSVYIHGVLHHLDAIEVCAGDGSCQHRGGHTCGDECRSNGCSVRPLPDELHAMNDDFSEHLDRIWTGFDPGDRYETTTINGRSYLLFMDPGC